MDVVDVIQISSSTTHSVVDVYTHTPLPLLHFFRYHCLFEMNNLANEKHLNCAYNQWNSHERDHDVRELLDRTDMMPTYASRSEQARIDGYISVIWFSLLDTGQSTV